MADKRVSVKIQVGDVVSDDVAYVRQEDLEYDPKETLVEVLREIADEFERFAT